MRKSHEDKHAKLEGALDNIVAGVINCLARPCICQRAEGSKVGTLNKLEFSNPNVNCRNMVKKAYEILLPIDRQSIMQ